MRMSDEEYFRSCVAKERQLAQLLGHHNIEECYESAGTLWDGNKALPKWTRDWKACGALLAQFEVSVCFTKIKDTADNTSTSVHAGDITVHFADHSSKERAIMFAIVKAVIFQLEHQQKSRASFRSEQA